MGQPSTCDVTTNNGETLRICHGPTVYVWRHHQQRGNTQDLPWADRLCVTSPPTTGKHSGFAMGRPSTCDVTTNNRETLRICHGPTVFVWRHHQQRGNTRICHGPTVYVWRHHQQRGNTRICHGPTVYVWCHHQQRGNTRICHGPTVYVWRHHQQRGNTQDLPWADRLCVTSPPTTGKHSGIAMGRPSTCDVTTNNGETLRICHGPTVYVWRHHQQRGNTQDLPWADRLCVTSPPTTGKHSGFAMGRPSTCDVTTNNGETLRICHGPTVCLCVTSPPTTGTAIDFLHKDKALVSTLILQHQRGEPPRKGVKRSTQ